MQPYPAVWLWKEFHWSLEHLQGPPVSDAWSFETQELYEDLVPRKSLGFSCELTSSFYGGFHDFFSSRPIGWMIQNTDVHVNMLETLLQKNSISSTQSIPTDVGLDSTKRILNVWTPRSGCVDLFVLQINQQPMIHTLGWYSWPIFVNSHPHDCCVSVGYLL